MAMPTKAKTWEFVVNQARAASGALSTDLRDDMFTIKSLFISGSFSTPWVVRGSSNSITATACPADPDDPPAGGADTWASAANVIWTTSPTGNRSWIVLRQTGVGPRVDLMINCYNAGSWNNSGIEAYISRDAGFTGGATNARPTATDEYPLKYVFNNNNANLFYPVWSLDYAQASFASVYNCQMADDGSSTRIWGYRAGLPISYWSVESVYTSDPDWDPAFIATIVGGQNPSNGCLYYTGNYGSVYATSITAGTYLYVGVVPGVGDPSNPWGNGCYVRCMAEARTGAAPISLGFSVVNDLTSEWPMIPVKGFVDGPPKRQLCKLYDLWFGAPAVAEGDLYPVGGGKDFVQVGDLILPWDGASTPQTT